MYQVEYSVRAIKTLKRVPANLRDRIMDKIDALAKNPRAPSVHVKKLKGREGYRLRIGDWRVLYDLDDDIMKVYVIDVGPRGGIYD